MQYEFVPTNLLKLKDQNHEVYLITIKKLNKKKLVVGDLFDYTTKQIFLREK